MNTTHREHAHLSRRDALKTLGAGVALIGLGLATREAAAAPTAPARTVAQPFTLPKLDYAYDALEPHIDARTMEIHYTKHHQAYITNANTALKEHPDLQSLTGEDILKRLDRVPEKIRTTLRNNVGGHLNHTFFWEIIGPARGGGPVGELASAIERTFGSLDAFQTSFEKAAASRFGSGWAWLVVQDGKLAVTSTANQDSPIMEGARPVLGVDVWEHAYYLKYQNRRADYVKAFWNVVQWEAVNAHYRAALKA